MRMKIIINVENKKYIVSFPIHVVGLYGLVLEN